MTIDPHLLPEQDEYMNRQAEACLDLVSNILDRFPARRPEPLERKLALHLLDAVLHDPFAAARPAVRAFLARRLRRIVEAVETWDGPEGTGIWKLYNHAFVVRTGGVSLGFDLVRTPSYLRDDPPETPDVVDRLVEICDVLFVSHAHGDHADPHLARAFLDAGKPVITAPGVFEDEDFHDRLLVFERRADAVRTLPLRNGARELRIVLYPGHQQVAENETIDNNVVLAIAPDGVAVCHMGDQAWNDDFAWIDSAGDHYRTDILLPNCWTPDMPRMIRGFRPRIVIPGHENEMGHGIEARIPHWRTYDIETPSAPILSLAWGESFVYRSEPSPAGTA